MWRWILPAIVSGIAALIAFFPMHWAAGWVLPEDVKAMAPDLKMRGTIWRGTISGLPLLGTANVDIAILSRRMDIQSGQGGNYVSGRFSPSEATDIDVRLDIASVPFSDGRLQGLRGTFAAQISQITLSGQSCETATGVARTDVLQRNGGKIDWTGPELAGPIRCEEGAIIADLSGQDAEQRISALIRLVPDGTYRADIDVRTGRVEADAVLPLFGFSRSGPSFVLTEQGKWR